MTPQASEHGTHPRAMLTRLTRKIAVFESTIKEGFIDEDSSSCMETEYDSLELPEFIFPDLAGGPLADIIGAYRNIRSLERDIYSFSQLLDKRAKCLRKEYGLRIRKSIDKIPDEILSEIFQQACSSDSVGVRFSFTLSHVCKRFRAAALHTPAIWATVTDDLPPEWIKLCLERSISSPLTVRINDEIYDKEDGLAVSSQEFCDFVSLISPSCYRWKSFTYFEPVKVEYFPKDSLDDYIHCSGDVAEMQLQSLRCHTYEMAFPALRNLSVSAPYPVYIQDTLNNLFFSSWACPHLTSFHGQGGLPNSLPSTLTMYSLHLRNDCDEVYDVHDYQDFLEHLASLNNLKKLVLRLEILDMEDEQKYIPSDCHTMVALEELHIVYVRSVEMTQGGRDEGFDSVHFFKSMFVHMELPALKTLTCEFIIEGNVFRNIQEVLPVASRCPKLRQLTLKHRPYTHSYINMDNLAAYVTAGPTGLQSILPLFPQIHYLELDGPGLCQFTDDSEIPVKASFPPLRAITLRGITDSDKKFVIDLLRCLRRGKDWHLFETLELDAYE